jgi:hypothetical protein
MPSSVHNQLLELLHLPHKAAGVEEEQQRLR